MEGLKEIDLVREQAEKCVRCGLCLTVCPVYAELQDERYVARGRNRLLSEVIDNHKDLRAHLKDRFSKCLLCRRCYMVCPQGVRTDLLNIAARAELVKGDGLPIYKSITFRKLLKNRNIMRKALKAALKFQWLLPTTKEPEGKLHHIPLETEGKIRHLPVFLAGLGGGRQLPTIAKKSLSEQVPEENPPLATVKSRNIRVAYFSGCATEFSFPEVGKALIKRLNQLGVEVVFPKKQGCCGIAVYASGDLETAREMALYNVDVFSKLDVDFVVTGCATCGSALKDGWASYLPKDKEERKKFEGFGAKVRDISELLVELADFKPLRYRSLLPENTRVTYHDPCHLARYQGVIEQPRKILRQVFGDNFVEMDNKGCCGMGGSFNVEHYELSKKIAKKKIDSIERTETDVVINTCPGCMIQLIDNIERYHLPQRVVHMVEAIEPIPESEE
ncbi:MAG: (Fe-S)-binding protein [Deltaproteobacteria bacterium]|nr:(Fe-S)-binding protein [Deltaproteobacteria bacterium]